MGEDRAREVPRLPVSELWSVRLQLANLALVAAVAVLVGGDPVEGSWALVGVMVFDLAVLWGAIASFVVEKRGLPAEDVEHYVELAHERGRLLTRFVEWIVLGVNASIGAALFLTPTITVLLTFAGIAGPLVVFLPGLTRVQREMRRIAGTNVPGTELASWRGGGLFYWAPDDPAIVVPKRIGIGTTLNMAHPVSWILIGAVVVVPLLIMLMVAV